MKALRKPTVFNAWFHYSVDWGDILQKTSQPLDSTDQHGFMDQTIPQAMGWTISFFKFGQTMAETYGNFHGNFPKIVTIPNRGLCGCDWLSSPLRPRIHVQGVEIWLNLFWLLEKWENPIWLKHIIIYFHIFSYSVHSLLGFDTVSGCQFHQDAIFSMNFCHISAHHKCPLSKL